MEVHILLHFYHIGVFFYGLFFAIALVKQNPELIRRTATLLVLLHLVCLALSQGILGWRIWVCSLLGLGGYELSQQYQMGLAKSASIGALLFGCIFILQPELAEYQNRLELTILPVSTLALIIAIGPKDIVRNKSYLAAVIGLFLIPCSLLLMGLANLNLNFALVPLVLVQFNDSFSYLFGKKFGRTHLFPNVSPGKTLEGYFLGSSGIAFGLLLLHTYIPILHTNLYQDIALFIGTFILGNAGDLIFSCLKRNLEIKDFSQILPGHGGILDRFDSILLIAPFFYFMANHKFLH